MARILNDNEWLVCIGSTALRAPDGTPYPSVPMYVIVNGRQVDKKTGISEGETELNNDIAKVLAEKFKQYVDGVKAAGITESV